MSDPVRRIGFIGLGIMGAPMAGHLLRAGHRLCVHSRTAAKGRALVEAGATWFESPADVARASELLMTMLPDTPDVERVLFGPAGAADALPRGACVVDLSTICPERTRAFAGQLAARGVSLLDAPVTGGDVGARDATLTIMVGGDAAAFEQVQPVLTCLGRRIVHVGPSGSGQMLKACNQVLCAVNMIATCEALTLAERSGLDLDIALETLAAGAGGSWSWSQLGPKIARGDLLPAFMIKLMQKDLRIVQRAAAALGVHLPGTALAQERFGVVAAEPGGGELGTQAMIRAYRERA